MNGKLSLYEKICVSVVGLCGFYFVISSSIYIYNRLELPETLEGIIIFAIQLFVINCFIKFEHVILKLNGFEL